MTESEMLKAIRSRFINAYTMSGKHYRELVIPQNKSRIIAEFAPDDGKRMNELIMTYGQAQ
ncbi:MAG: hypothetical protein OQK29_01350 [Ignavibacteriaceae bacterium]|nr:hypothetical protein [Ignavibacteriaceae bacterium]